MTKRNLGGIVIVATLALGLVVWQWPHRDMWLHRVGLAHNANEMVDIEVSQQEIDAFQANNDRSNQIFRTSNPSSQGPKDYARDELVMLKALRAEGEKRGIHITTKDLDIEQAALYASFGSKRQYTQYLTDLHLDAKQLNIPLEVNLLKAKLGTQLLDTKDVSMVFVRWDTPYFNGLTPDQKLSQEKAAQDKLKTNFLPLISSKATRDEIASKADFSPANSRELNNQRVALMTSGAPVGFDYILGYNPTQGRFHGYTGDMSKGTKANDEMIAALHKVGETTPVFKSSSGYYVAFRLEAVHGGSYSSWADFLHHYSKTSKAPASASTDAIDRTGAVDNCVGLPIDYKIQVLNRVNQNLIQGLLVTPNSPGRVDCSNTYSQGYDPDGSGTYNAFMQLNGWGPAWELNLANVEALGYNASSIVSDSGSGTAHSYQLVYAPGSNGATHYMQILLSPYAVRGRSE